MAISKFAWYQTHNPKILQQHLQALRILRQCGPINTRYGICWNLQLVLRAHSQPTGSRDGVLLALLWEDWEHYSGNHVYPVRWVKDGTMAPQPWQGLQQELRFELLDYLIAKLEILLPAPVPPPLTLKEARRTCMKHAWFRFWHRWF